MTDAPFRPFETHLDLDNTTAILRDEIPDLKVRFINVVDLFKLISEEEHPHGLSDRDFDSLFTRDKPVIFNFHGYPWLIHKLVYRRSEQERGPQVAKRLGEAGTGLPVTGQVDLGDRHVVLRMEEDGCLVQV